MSPSRGAPTAANCARLWEAAKRAGVQKIVMASHTRTSVDSPFPYIAGKATAEAALRDSGVNYAIVRPCGIFGDTAAESILMNNAAWVLRPRPVEPVSLTSPAWSARLPK